MNRSSENALNRLDILPFGAQYYRAPTPLASDWERDLKNFAAHGFNTIKIWACWRSNNPREGVFDFSDIDRLMDLSAANGLKVIINLIFDTAPAWFFKKYPESMMVLPNGDKIYPETTAARQMGGAPGPCLHHKKGIEIRQEFVRRIAQRYKDHPALMCWDLWNEPEHTCCIKREQIPENLTCYCDESIKEFKLWLEKKYTDIDGLNFAWNAN